jgi:hypothetical protein
MRVGSGANLKGSASGGNGSDDRVECRDIYNKNEIEAGMPAMVLRAERSANAAPPIPP